MGWEQVVILSIQRDNIHRQTDRDLDIMTTAVFRAAVVKKITYKFQITIMLDT